ncbi:MAG: hypothetical protein PVI57_03170 [Gemmatimonadota bacterium]|jgi:DNA-binding beta-propeller fold protein YncE
MHPRTTRLIRTLQAFVLTGLTALGGCDAPELPPDDALLVSSIYDDHVRVLDPATGDLLEELEVGSGESAREEPAGMAVAGDASAWYLVLGHRPPGLAEFSGRSGEPKRTISLPDFRNASRVGLSPDGHWAVVTEYYLGEAVQRGHVAFVDLESERVGLMAPCQTPYGVAFDAQGTQVALSCPTGDEVVVLDGGTFEVRNRFIVTSPDVISGNPGNPVSRPMGLAWAPGGDRIFVALYDEQKLGIYTPQGDFFRGVALGARPVNLAVTGRGRYVVVVTRETPTVTVVDTRSGEARAMPLSDARNPHDVAVSPDGRTAYVAWEGGPEAPGGVTAVDLDEGVVLWEQETGPMTTAVVYRAGSSPAPAGGSTDDGG